MLKMRLMKRPSKILYPIASAQFRKLPDRRKIDKLHFGVAVATNEIPGPLQPEGK
jgi:hypothetical protein